MNILISDFQFTALSTKDQVTHITFENNWLNEQSLCRSEIKAILKEQRKDNAQPLRLG